MTKSNDTFLRMDAQYEPSEVSNKRHTSGDFLRMMNDPKKRAEYQNLKLAIQHDGLTPRRVYESKDWATFVPDVFLDTILENVSYQSVSSQLANQISVNTGLTFKYREFSNFQRAQRGAENTEFERTKGSRDLQEVPFHTLGVRSYVTEEEMMDIPFSSMQLELNTMGASLALERDLLWINSLYNATTGTNATTFHNELTSSAALDLEGLHGVLTWFAQPFNATLSSITLTDPFENGTTAEEVEGQMRLGRFRPTDVILNSASYFSIVNNSFLQSQNIWTNSKILDSGELQVPLLGVNIHKANIGYFTDADDSSSWVPTNDIYVVDRRQGGAGTINSKQPLQVRNWVTPATRTEDFMIFERSGFAVQNRRGLVKIVDGSGS